MGRVLLAGWPRAEQDAYLRRTQLRRYTPSTRANPGELIDTLRQVADKGYAIVDQEFEYGPRSVAVPVYGKQEVVAALNIGTQRERIAEAELHSRYLPALMRVSEELKAIGID